jgi:signal transduction histidine kinase
MERQIIHSAKMAELGTIGSSIAHEINNPLAGLLSFIQLIKMDLTGKEDFYEDIIEMESGARRCKSIVQNLLNFSRQTNLDEQVQIDLREIVEQSIRITEIQTRSKGIMIHTQLEKQPIWVRGNATQLTQALRNLLQNANEGINARLRDEPEIVGRIELDSEINGKSVLLTISDNGQGIHHSIIRRIFNPNFTTKDPNLNPGVGLTTARQIIAEHGGSLEIISEPRQRTRAIISLPVLKALD